MKPAIGRIVIFRGLEANGSMEHPAIITRCWSDRDTKECAVMVNLTVLPDTQPPFVCSSVQLFDTRDEALVYAGGRLGHFVAHWPARLLPPGDAR